MSKPKTSRFDSLGKKLRAKKKREKKQKARKKRLRKQRDEKLKKLRESDPEINYLELMCKSKAAYPNAVEALKHKPRDLDMYECNVCMGWHFTSIKQRDECA